MVVYRVRAFGNIEIIVYLLLPLAIAKIHTMLRCEILEGSQSPLLNRLGIVKTMSLRIHPRAEGLDNSNSTSRPTS